jgi:ferric-dicitrate binding protein FerR (iron transport regulator)
MEWESNPHKIISYKSIDGWKKVDQLIGADEKSGFAWMKALYSSAAVLVVLFLSSVFLYLYNNQLVTIQTSEGQQMKLTLPDSTIVNLNADSEISYSQFAYFFNRELNLTGEAFFDVAHQKFRKLNVNAEKLNVTVLGTRFNVDTRAENDQIEVVLEEGIVELSIDGNDTYKEQLLPNQRALVNTASDQIQLSGVEAKLYSLWKEKNIHCRNMPIEEFFAKVSERYNVTFELDNDIELKKILINFTIKNDELSELLKIIEIIVPIKIERDALHYRVSLNN